MAVGLVGFLAGGPTLKVESAMDSRRFSDTQKLSRFKDAAAGLSLMDVVRIRMISCKPGKYQFG